MFLEYLCPPALLYVAFSLTQIIIDIFKNMYNTAFLKMIVTIIFTIALNTLCNQGLSVISWFIVFIPFIAMSIITTLLLFAFGLSPSTGKIDYNVDYPDTAQDNTSATYQDTATNNQTKVQSINNGDDMNDYEVPDIPVGSSDTKINKIKIIRHKAI
jgi:hypothetical protein